MTMQMSLARHHLCRRSGLIGRHSRDHHVKARIPCADYQHVASRPAGWSQRRCCALTTRRIYCRHEITLRSNAQSSCSDGACRRPTKPSLRRLSGPSPSLRLRGRAERIANPLVLLLLRRLSDRLNSAADHEHDRRPCASDPPADRRDCGHCSAEHVRVARESSQGKGLIFSSTHRVNTRTHDRLPAALRARAARGDAAPCPWPRVRHPPTGAAGAAGRRTSTRRGGRRH